MSRKIIAGMMVLATVAVSVARADTLMTVKEGSRMAKAVEEMPEGMSNSFGGDETTVRYWSRADRMARIDGASRVIGRFDRGETYVINDTARTCSAIKLPDSVASDNADAGPEFQKTGESRQIGSWQADGYELSVPGDDGEGLEVAIWVSEEVTTGLDAYRAYTESVVVTPMMRWMVTALDLGGYPVRQEVRMGPIATWSEIISVSDEPAPSGIYEIPDGYAGCD